MPTEDRVLPLLLKRSIVLSQGRLIFFLYPLDKDSKRVNAERQQGQADRMSAAVNEAHAGRKQSQLSWRDEEILLPAGNLPDLYIIFWRHFPELR